MLEAAAALAALVLFFLAGLFLLRAWGEKAGAGKGSAPGSADPGDALIYYNGAWYRPRKGLETVLAIGVDQAAVDDKQTWRLKRSQNKYHERVHTQRH